MSFPKENELNFTQNDSLFLLTFEYIASSSLGSVYSWRRNQTRAVENTYTTLDGKNDRKNRVSFIEERRFPIRYDEVRRLSAETCSKFPPALVTSTFVSTFNAFLQKENYHLAKVQLFGLCSHVMIYEKEAKPFGVLDLLPVMLKVMEMKVTSTGKNAQKVFRT